MAKDFNQINILRRISKKKLREERGELYGTQYKMKSWVTYRIN